MMNLLFLIVALLFAGPALAHDRWKNGDPVPAWIKSSCCGPNDVHLLDPSQITRDAADDYVVNDGGHVFRIKADKALPSQDGYSWIFYNANQANCQTEQDGMQPCVYCFFVPLAF